MASNVPTDKGMTDNRTEATAEVTRYTGLRKLRVNDDVLLLEIKLTERAIPWKKIYWTDYARLWSVSCGRAVLRALWIENLPIIVSWHLFPIFEYIEASVQLREHPVASCRSCFNYRSVVYRDGAIGRKRTEECTRVRFGAFFLISFTVWIVLEVFE